MQFRPIAIDDTRQELTQHGTDAFPLSLDLQAVANKGINGILHWHYELQVSLVVSGSVLFMTEGKAYEIKEGEAIFINAKTLHKASTTADCADGEYISLNFLPKIIYGYSSSQILQDYVSPILNSPDFDLLPLHANGWQQEICELVRQMGIEEAKKAYGYELKQKILVNQIWHLLVLNNQNLLESGRNISFDDRQRINDLQKYIHHHYPEKLSLDDLARAVHISRGECCRLFKRALNQTPFEYLNRYRISQSQKLLSSTNVSIAEIALQTGFSSSSYFAECFRKEIEMTPLEYRKNFQP